MANELKSIFKDEINLHLILRKEELSSESYRHYKHTVWLFDEYLYSINLSEKSIDEPIIEDWIKKISDGISINTVSGHIHYIRQLLLFLTDNGYHCFIPKTIGVFERRTREVVYTTIIKIFGIQWFEKSFSENLQNTLKGKGNNKTQLIEGALNELTYEQLKEYLFVPYSNYNFEDMLDKEFAKENLDKLSKEEIISIIEKCRKVSLWNRFFGEYEQFKDFESKIGYLQPYRNTVMHNKRITKDEYEKVRKSLKSINKLLSEAVSMIEDEIYTDTKLIDVVSALGNICSKILGNSIQNWVEKVKPTLASLGKIVIEAAMPKINISAIMPELNLGTELSKRFEEIYKAPQLDVSRLQGIQGVVSSFDSVNMDALKAVYNNAGLDLKNQIAEQANKLNAVCNMSSFNSTGLQELKKIADRYNDTSSDFEMTEKNGQTGQYYDNESKTLDEEKKDKDTQ